MNDDKCNRRRCSWFNTEPMTKVCVLEREKTAQVQNGSDSPTAKAGGYELDGVLAVQG